MNDAWAADWLRRFGGSAPDGPIELYAEDARFEDITLSQAVRGSPALREFFGDFMNPANRRNAFTLIGYSGDADGGAIEWTWTATHSVPFLDLPAKGKRDPYQGRLRAAVQSREDSRATRLLGCENGGAATGCGA